MNTMVYRALENKTASFEAVLRRESEVISSISQDEYFAVLE